MKKILLFSLLVILIPYVVVTVFIKNEEIQFIFSSNTMVRILRTNTNVVDVVPLEEYVIGVVAGEMPASFSLEALKAQAVASRSYVMYQMIKNKDKDYDVVDTVLNQVYIDSESLKEKWGDNYVTNINKIKLSVMDTAYEYLTYNSDIVEALFFSTSSGYTENSEEVFISEVPYLRSVVSQWDSISPVFNYSLDYTYDTFCSLLGINYTTELDIEILDQTSVHKIKKIRINEKVFTGSEVSSKLKLKSSNFTIEEIDDKVIVTSHGYGHGVGMSQYGAEGMAQAGFTYDEILKYYYTDVLIEKIKN